MAGLQPKLTQDISYTIDRMWHAVLPIIKVEFTYEEVLALTTPPDTREVILEAVRLCEGFGQATVNCPLGDRAPGFEVSFRIREPSLVPKTTWLQDAAPAGIREKFDEWLTHRLQIGRDWGRVMAVVKELCTLAPSPAQLRTAFPAIRIVWQHSNDVKSNQLAVTHEAHKPGSRAPFIPYGLRESAIDAAETLLTFTTLPKLESSYHLATDLRATGRGDVSHTDRTGFRFAIL